jgi:hypothetical protein
MGYLTRLSIPLQHYYLAEETMLHLHHEGTPDKHTMSTLTLPLILKLNCRLNGHQLSCVGNVVEAGGVLVGWEIIGRSQSTPDKHTI